ncbi:metal-dependent hydrolase, partial [Staphylococcus aureus]|nr:metal-dependent hydrolase [Staphylococcus aureus]
ERKVNLEGTDDLTVAFLLAKLSWHERHHLEHIKIALSN